jgi:hypothetical protein
VASAPADPGDQLFGEAFGTALGGTLAQPGVQHLTGVGARRQQRVIAERLGVAVRGALLVLAVDLADRRVQIDRHRRVARSGAQ